MIRDRGNIKWNAMMLPEHVKKLREWKKQDEYEEKPELDEFTLQDISEQLIIAYENRYEVELKIWKNRHTYRATGLIVKLNAERGTLMFEDGRTFFFESIYGITIMD